MITNYAFGDRYYYRGAVMPYHGFGRIQPRLLEQEQLNLFTNHTIAPSYASKADALLKIVREGC